MPRKHNNVEDNSATKSASNARKSPLTPALSPPRGEGIKPLGEAAALRTSKPASTRVRQTLAAEKTTVANEKHLLLPHGRRIEDEGAPSKLTQAKARYRTRTVQAKNFARSLRQHSTDAEKRLWRLLRDRRFNDFKFRRQYACGAYFLDFYCPDARLAVELDGSGHGFPDQKEKDTVRDQYLASQGIKVMRLWNNQLSKELATIRETIWYELMDRTGRTQEIAHYLRLPKP